MKNAIIPFDKLSDIRLIIELAKRLGIKSKVETSKKAIKPMQWVLMPEDEDELEAQIEKAEKAIKSGKYYTSEQVREIVSKWK